MFGSLKGRENEKEREKKKTDVNIVVHCQSVSYEKK